MTGCSSGKVGYATRNEATTTLRRSGRQVGGNKPYLCSECGLWHMGRKAPKHVQRGIRRHMEGRFPDERRLDG